MTIKELIDRYGLAELNTRTRISNDNLLNLLNEDYDAVGKANGLGFLKILEREFEVDLSSEIEKLKEQAKDSTYVPKELLLTERKYKSGKKFAGGAFLFAILLGGLVYVIYLINSQNGDSGVENPTQSSTQPIEEIKEQVVQPAIVQSIAKENEKPKYEEIESIEQNTTQSAEQNLSLPKEDENLEKIVVVQDAVEQTQEQNSTQNEPNETEQEQKAEVLEVFKDISEVVITPRKKLWLGAINLDTKQRIQKNKSDAIVIDENNTIIVTGHGWLEIAQKEFIQGERLYFHFVNNELKRLNEKAFKELNEGRIW